jgi:hypothetical protein
MKIIVAHSSPDMDAISAVWLIKKFLPGWENATVKFVPAGGRIDNGKWRNENEKSPIECIEGDEVIHVDTGLGPLDHHQTASDKVCGASLTWDYIRTKNKELKTENSDKMKDRIEAINRMIKVITEIDHFKEVFWKEPLADYHVFDLDSILGGLKHQYPDQDDYYVEFISKCLDTVLHEFENRIWAEREIEQKGQKFETQFGKGIGFETINDSVVKLAQKMGYAIVLRKDPRKGYVRIKARPENKIDLTATYEDLKKLDPDATWFLHISKKMLLNGSVKNPKMRPSKLEVKELIRVLEEKLK